MLVGRLVAGPGRRVDEVDSGSRDGAATPDTGIVDDGGTVMDDAGITEPDSGIALPDAGIRVDAGPAECPPRTYPCECATGYYCLMIGAMCIAPSSPCPP